MKRIKFNGLILICDDADNLRSFKGSLKYWQPLRGFHRKPSAPKILPGFFSKERTPRKIGGEYYYCVTNSNMHRKNSEGVNLQNYVGKNIRQSGLLSKAQTILGAYKVE